MDIINGQNNNEVRTHKIKTKDYGFLSIDDYKPALEVTTDFNQFLQIVNDFSKNIINYLQEELKCMTIFFGNDGIPNLSSRLSNTITKIEGLVKRWKNNNFSENIRTFGIPNTYSVKEALAEIRSIANKYVYYANEIISKNNSEIEKIIYTNSREEFLKLLQKNEEKVIVHFAKLDSDIVMNNYIDDSLIKKTAIAKEKRSAVFQKFFSYWRQVPPGSYLSKEDGKRYKYSLVKFYEKLEKLKNKQERLFWRVEVEKVSLLNRPHFVYDNKKKVKKVFDGTPSDYIIELENVMKYYTNGVTTNKVLSNVELKLKPGELVVILGPSGSGKTTLLNIISGMDRASYGKTIVANTNLLGLTDTQLTEFRRRNIGYIFQQYGLLPNLTVKENIEIGAHLQDNPAKRLNIDELLKDIDMFEHRNKLPSELSGGQQQRVSILRAIAKNPKIIFGDEPTGALDEQMTQIVLDQFVKINRKYKTTMILVTHNPLIAEIATCVIKVGNGTIQSVTYNPTPKEVNEVKWSSN